MLELERKGMNSDIVVEAGNCEEVKGPIDEQEINSVTEWST